MYAKKIKRLLLAVIALLVVSMSAGSWAYWSQELQVRNEFQLGKYSTQIKEDFVAPSDWLPGVNVNKDVSVVNEGTLPVFVKAVISQNWVRTANVYNRDGEVILPEEGEEFPLTFVTDTGEEFAALIDWGEDVVVLAPEMRTMTASELPQVNSIEEALGKWILTSETPDENGDYILYYVGVLDGGLETPLAVDGVTMNPKIQATIIERKTVWDKEAGEWITVETENASYGYENARYTMTVSMFTVQATDEALLEMFPADTIGEQSIISYLGTQGIQQGEPIVNDGPEKKLYFGEADGKIAYVPVGDSEGYWFMSHLDMIPGGKYVDTLTIENQSSKTFDLYMQVIPLDQTELPDALLEYIYMKVYLGGTLIYDGTALGKEYSSTSINNLQDVILLGTYGASAVGELRVELELQKDIPMEYSGILSNIDWKFMVEEQVPEPTPTPGGPGTPTTGGESGVTWYVVLMGVGGVMLMTCAIVWFWFAGKKRRDEEEANA